MSSTKDALSFEEDTLDALLDGFAASGWKKTAAASIPGGDDPKVASATAAKPHARKAASAAKAGVAEAQAKAPAAAATPATTASKTEKTEKTEKATKPTAAKPAADPPAAAPEPTPTVEAPAPSELASGMPPVCAAYAKAACDDPSLPPEIDRKQFCAGVHRRVDGLVAKEADPGKACKALLKNMTTPQHRTR